MESISKSAEERTALQRRWGLLGAYIAILLFAGLGHHGLLEPDEGRYANMALEFLEPEHHWSEPMLSDVEHYDKPPLIYWITGGFLKVFGANETAARLPSFTGSLLALAGVFLIAFRLYGERPAWWSVLACATTFQFWLLGRLLSPDMLMCGFFTLGTGLVLWEGKGPWKWVSWGAGALCWTLAWWTKATAALVPLAALSLALLITGRRDLLSRLRPLRLLGLVLLVGSPWYVVMMTRHAELREFFFHRELVGRVTGHADGRTGFPGFHFVAAAALWLPWWPKVVALAWRHRHRWMERVSWKGRLRSLPFEPVTALLILVIFSAISSKLITYTLPGVPMLAVAVGSLMRKRQFSFRNADERWLAIGAVLAAALVLTLPLVESDLGSNSSTRKAVEQTRALGAKGWISDRFLPGLEFYGGESVWYVNTDSLVQVDDSKGQSPKDHFLEAEEAHRFVSRWDRDLWLVQAGKLLPHWKQRLIEERSEPDTPPLKVGNFLLWKLK